MKQKKLIIKTKTEKYPIIIGSNLISKTSSLLKKNSINFKKCLIVIDKNVPSKFVKKIKNSFSKKKYTQFLIILMKKIKIRKLLIRF